MNPNDQRKAYQNFFLKTEPGAAFVAELDRLITDCHSKAENEPELARDHVQRAKGIRMIKNHLDSVMAERGKPISE